jgi:branched-chain amino acid transport system permease protein
MTVALLLEQTLNGLQLGVMLFLMAAGLTLVFGVMGLINLAHGSLYMVGGVRLCGGGGLDRLVLAGPDRQPGRRCGSLAHLVEIVVIRRLYDRDHLDQVLATFALVLIFSEGVAPGSSARLSTVS